VAAPYIREFPLVLECKLLQIVEIGLHTQFIGEIMDVKCDEEIIADLRHLILKYSVKTMHYVTQFFSWHYRVCLGGVLLLT